MSSIRETAQLKGDTGTPSAEVGGLFEGVGELEDAEVLLVAADDLQADGQAFGREACGHGSSGIAGSGDVPAALHPVDVVGEVNAVDLGGPGRVDVEGRQLRGGQDEVLVAFQEGLKAAPHVGVRDLCAGDVVAGEREAFFDLGGESVLEAVGM